MGLLIVQSHLNKYEENLGKDFLYDDGAAVKT